MLLAGVDIIEIERVKAAVASHGDRFLERVYTRRERAICQDRVESLAGRFAAKEATAKALGTGVWRDGVRWTDIEIDRDAASGQPRIRLYGDAAVRAQMLGATDWAISISHDRSRAIAFVVAQGA